MFQKEELTLLTKEQIWENGNGEQLDVFKKYGAKCAMTDLAILTGGEYDYSLTKGLDSKDDDLEVNLCWFHTQSLEDEWCFCTGGPDGFAHGKSFLNRTSTVRPVLLSSSILNNSSNRVKGYNVTEEIEYGEYPQNAVDPEMQRTLENAFDRRILQHTGKTYTFDSTPVNGSSTEFNPVVYEEYEYNGSKYIRVKANPAYNNKKTKLSNGEEYKKGNCVWVKVEPVRWLIDDKTGILVSKKGILSGINYYSEREKYRGNFNKNSMKEYLDKYMLKDLFYKASKITLEERQELEKRSNPYGLNFGQASEEDIIRGAIESGVAVFLHGASSEGKSARVKQIDPTCEIIYLRNASPESLNGKSVYNGATGEMIDVKPTWLKKVEEKCEREPDRYHVIFLDEITNALPSIQGIAFNIVLDREVNGIWKLPDNARIVAAGNDMKDSLAANQLVEPLFNRFAHVYIKTTTESWLRWASDHNIHPAIYAYIAYKKGETLRSKYDGEKPNADPRKWEMASKMLYATGQPEMLRALVGEDITREFVQFCNQKVITLDDVLSGSVNEKDIQVLNTAERYATTMGLLQVDDTNLEKVREFAVGMGAEFGAIFDELWTRGDESRLERIAEAKLVTREKRGMRK